MPAFTAYLPSEVLSIPLLSQNAKNTGTWPRSCPGSPPDVCGVRARALPAPSILGEGSEGAVQVDLHVTGPLELLEDDVVHAAAGVDDRGGHDRQGAAFLDVPGRREEPAGPLERVGIEPARKHLPRGRNNRVVGAGKSRE